jgi:Holliday junction resolvase RusA-like endonuclease
MISITLPIDPVAKGRPRFTKSGRVYTPSKTAHFESAIQRLLAPYKKTPAISGALVVSLVFTLVPPKKRVRDAPSVKPDLDNFIKAVTDAANGILWQDDGQITELHARKLYTWVAKRGSVEIRVDQAKGTP